MQTVGTHGLNCPDPDDYAAVALYMQQLALQIDAELDAQLDAFNSFQDRPTIVVTNSVNVSVPANNSTFAVYDTVLFNNSSFLGFTTGFVDTAGSSRNVINIGSAPGISPVVPYLVGNYSVGACIRQTASGAVDAFTMRALNVQVEDFSVGPTLITSETDATWDTNTGGNEAENVKFTFELSRTSGVLVSSLVFNGNSSSAVNALAGGLMWVTYNGPLSIVEVA